MAFDIKKLTSIANRELKRRKKVSTPEVIFKRAEKEIQKAIDLINKTAKKGLKDDYRLSVDIQTSIEKKEGKISSMGFSVETEQSYNGRWYKIPGNAHSNFFEIRFILKNAQDFKTYLKDHVDSRNETRGGSFCTINKITMNTPTPPTIYHEIVTERIKPGLLVRDAYVLLSENDISEDHISEKIQDYVIDRIFKSLPPTLVKHLSKEAGQANTPHTPKNTADTTEPA